MNKHDEIEKILSDLVKTLRVKHNLPPDRPTSMELNLIVKEILLLSEEERTEQAWKEIVDRNVKFEEYFIYKGLDTGDINLLLSQLLILLREEE